MQHEVLLEGQQGTAAQFLSLLEPGLEARESPGPLRTRRCQAPLTGRRRIPAQLERIPVAVLGNEKHPGAERGAPGGGICGFGKD